jgi:membrane fusion protein, multidrug efflux system
VKSGQVIAEIEVPELLAELPRHRAAIARGEAEVTRARAAQGKVAAELAVATSDQQRLAKARQTSPDLVVPQQLDEARARVDTAKAAQQQSRAEEQVAQAALAEARANLERVETLLAFTKITAPFAGVVTARHVDPGAFIPAATSGSAAQTAAIVALADFSKVRVQVPVPTAEATRVAVGQPVKLTAEGLAGKTFSGKVSRHSHALDEGTQTLLVEADLPNPDGTLRPGMFANVRVGVEKHLDAMQVPVEALVMEKVNAFVFVHAEGKAKKTAVKIGFNDGVNVEITSGLKGDEQVLLVGKTPPADGAAVKVTEVR